MPPRAMLQAARLIVKPQPTTLSESFSILRHLRTIGEVTKFIKYTGSEPEKQDGTNRFGDGNEIVYDVEFSSILQKPQEPSHSSNQKSLLSSIKFKVDANSFQPDPRDIDPYNVRGLLDRKPHPPPQKFSCKLTWRPSAKSRDPSTETESAATSSNNDTELNLSEKRYMGPFNVNKSSVLGKVHRMIDTPRHLITGLLPKGSLDDQITVQTEEEGREPKKMTSRQAVRRARKRQAKQSMTTNDENPFSLMKLYEEEMQRRKGLT